MTDSLSKRRAPILDGRLSAAMALGRDTRFFADIGADHGRLSTVLLLDDPKRRALVADISAAALSKAQTRIHRMQLQDRTVFAVADGLDALDVLPTEIPDTIFILGMGGDTVSGILQKSAAKLKSAALVLGAQTELSLVRTTLLEIGYRIRREVVANESSRDYILIRAERAEQGESGYTEEELLLGPCLLRDAPMEWLPVLERRKRLLTQAIAAMSAAQNGKDSDRCHLFQRELTYVTNAVMRIKGEDQRSDNCPTGCKLAE